MFTQPTPLYSVSGRKGAWYFIDCYQSAPIPPTQPADMAIVQLVGSSGSLHVPAAIVAPYTQADAMTEGDPITMLAQEAVILFGADPARANRAAELARSPYNVQQAAKDEQGETIKKSLNVFAVKGSSGWYVVRPGACTCEDHKRGHVCKHRLAAWMYRENIVRSIASVRKVAPSVVLAELVS